MVLNNLNRWQAFGIHLGISLVIFIVLLGLIVFSWYPGVFFNFGGMQGIKIVAGVDLVLGPMLTLIVYNAAKKSLKMDLAIIALIQISALTYGVWTVHQQRPYAQVLSYDGLHILTAGDFSYYDIELATSFSADNPSIPVKAYLDLPRDEIQINQIAFTSEFVEKVPLALRVDLYLSVENPPTDGLNFLLAKYSFEETQQCLRLPVVSTYYAGDGCFNSNDGTFELLEPDPSADKALIDG